MTGPKWSLGPGAVHVGRDVVDSMILTGPVQFVQVSGSMDRLQDAIFDHGPLYAQLGLGRFTGRIGIVKEIDRWMAGRDNGYVVIRGESGIGKSALAAHLAWTRPCAYHFTRLGGGARLPVEVRRSLAAQLIATWQLQDEFAPSGVLPAGASRPDWLAKVLRAAARRRDELVPGRPIVLVIDGLDEAESDEPGLQTGVPLGLPAPEVLPPGVFILVTSLYGSPLLALRDPRSAFWLSFGVESDDNLSDMREYLTSIAGGALPDQELVSALRRHGHPVQVFVDALMSRCRGVWIYLQYVLDEIRLGTRTPADVSLLPDRLRTYYLMRLYGWANDPVAWRKRRLPVLAALAALRRPITATDLAALLGADADRDEVADWLDTTVRPFLAVTRGKDHVIRYAIRHESLRELFRPGNSSAGTDVQQWGDGLSDGGFAERLPQAWAEANGVVAESLIPDAHDGVRDWSGIDDYARTMLARHAAAAGQLDRLMADPHFVLTCDTWSILSQRTAVRAPETTAAMAALEAASSGLAVDLASDRRWPLHVWARRTGAGTLAGNLARQAPEWPWVVEAAVWSGQTNRVLTGPTDAIWSLAATPTAGGRTVMAGGSGNAVWLWDAATGQLVAPPLTGHTSRVWSVTVMPMPDGHTLLASGSDDRTVRWWDPTTAAPVGDPFAGHHEGVLAVAAVPMPDGRTVLAFGSGTVVHLWDLVAKRPISRPLTGHTSWVWSVAALPRPDGRTLIASASNDGTIRLWIPISKRWRARR